MSAPETRPNTRAPIALIGIGIVMVVLSLAGAPVAGREWIGLALFIGGIALAAAGVFIRRQQRA